MSKSKPICVHCDKKMPDKAKYCPHCGKENSNSNTPMVHCNYRFVILGVGGVGKSAISFAVY